MEDQLITDEEIEIIEKLFVKEILTDEDLVELSAIFDEDE